MGMVESFTGPLRQVELCGGLYILYEDGRIYCPPRIVACKNGFRTLKAKYLKHRKDSNGYRYVTLYDKDGVAINHRIHRLLMLTFNNFEGSENYVVNHIDRDKSNNSLINLEWATVKENMIHALEDGRRNLSYEYKDFIDALLLLRENSWSNAKIGRAFGRTSETIGANLKTHGIEKSQIGRKGGKLQTT